MRRHARLTVGSYLQLARFAGIAGDACASSRGSWLVSKGAWFRIVQDLWLAGEQLRRRVLPDVVKSSTQVLTGL